MDGTPDEAWTRMPKVQGATTAPIRSTTAPFRSRICFERAIKITVLNTEHSILCLSIFSSCIVQLNLIIYFCICIHRRSLHISAENSLQKLCIGEICTYAQKFQKIFIGVDTQKLYHVQTPKIVSLCHRWRICLEFLRMHLEKLSAAFMVLRINAQGSHLEFLHIDILTELCTFWLRLLKTLHL